jgi:hypothetical protein
MAEVKVAIKGAWQDVEKVMLRMDSVLSVTDIPASNETTIDADGQTVYILTVSADETPGGSDEFEFSRIKDPSFYRELTETLKSLSMEFQYLEQESVVRHDASWVQGLRAFFAKLRDYMNSTGEGY